MRWWRSFDDDAGLVLCVARIIRAFPDYTLLHQWTFYRQRSPVVRVCRLDMKVRSRQVWCRMAFTCAGSFLAFGAKAREVPGGSA